MTPAEAYRLSRARLLAEKYSDGSDGNCGLTYFFDVEHVANLVDAVLAEQQATIAQLRADLLACERSGLEELRTMRKILDNLNQPQEKT